MNDVKKTEFILNACYCKYVPECKMLYDSLSDFIYNMCIIYRKGMDRELSVVVWWSMWIDQEWKEKYFNTGIDVCTKMLGMIMCQNVMCWIVFVKID